MGKLSSSIGYVALGLMLPSLAGCPNPQTYGSPRTLDPGKVQHTVALEGAAAVGGGASGVAPNLPTYQLRVGLADSVDLGARITNLTMLGADVKWNFVRSKAIDLAIDPGFQGTYAAVGGNSAAVLYGHLPVLVGINVAEFLTIHLTPGMIAGFASSSVSSDNAAGSVAGSFLGARGGLGLNFRLTDGFALTPEATLIKPLTPNSGDGMLITFGLGFSFGAMPNYGEAPPAGGAPAPGPVVR